MADKDRTLSLEADSAMCPPRAAAGTGDVNDIDLSSLQVDKPASCSGVGDTAIATATAAKFLSVRPIPDSSCVVGRDRGHECAHVTSIRRDLDHECVRVTSISTSPAPSAPTQYPPELAAFLPSGHRVADHTCAYASESVAISGPGHQITSDGHHHTPTPIPTPTSTPDTNAHGADGSAIGVAAEPTLVTAAGHSASVASSLTSCSPLSASGFPPSDTADNRSFPSPSPSPSLLQSLRSMFRQDPADHHTCIGRDVMRRLRDVGVRTLAERLFFFTDMGDAESARAAAALHQLLPGRFLVFDAGWLCERASTRSALEQTSLSVSDSMCISNVITLCSSVEQWFAADPVNVAVLSCAPQNMGVLAASVLCFCGFVSSAQEGFERFQALISNRFLAALRRRSVSPSLQRRMRDFTALVRMLSNGTRTNSAPGPAAIDPDGCGAVASTAAAVTTAVFCTPWLQLDSVVIRALPECQPHKGCRLNLTVIQQSPSLIVYSSFQQGGGLRWLSTSRHRPASVQVETRCAVRGELQLRAYHVPEADPQAGDWSSRSPASRCPLFCIDFDTSLAPLFAIPSFISPPPPQPNLSDVVDETPLSSTSAPPPDHLIASLEPAPQMHAHVDQKHARSMHTCTADHEAATTTASGRLRYRVTFQLADMHVPPGAPPLSREFAVDLILSSLPSLPPPSVVRSPQSSDSHVHFSLGPPSHVYQQQAATSVSEFKVLSSVA